MSNFKKETSYTQQQIEDVLDYHIGFTQGQIEAITMKLENGELQPTDEVLDALNDLNDKYEVLTATRLQSAYIQILPMDPTDEIL